MALSLEEHLLTLRYLSTIKGHHKRKIKKILDLCLKLQSELIQLQFDFSQIELMIEIFENYNNDISLWVASLNTEN